MRVPQLLVSVRNGEEARAALAGGCEILDVKDPRRGSLGMADLAAISEAIDVGAARVPQQPVSAALGEVREWLEGSRSFEVPRGLAFVKMGCAGLSGLADWRAAWLQVRRQIQAAARSSPRWVAVAYADWQAAEAPDPDAVIEAAAEAGCSGVLFDTYLKTGRGLLDWIAAEELQRLAARVHERGLMLALAGSLRISDLPALAAVPADIVAIRTAACQHGQREGKIKAEAVREFRAALQRAWLPSN